MREWWTNLRRLLTPVWWVCEHCGLRQDCPDLIWDHLKPNLICRTCCWMQNYPEYIKPNFDPRPPR